MQTMLKINVLWIYVMQENLPPHIAPHEDSILDSANFGDNLFLLKSSQFQLSGLVLRVESYQRL